MIMTALVHGLSTGTHAIIMKGGTQGFPRHEVSDKQEVLFEDVSPTTAFSIRQRQCDYVYFHNNLMPVVLTVNCMELYLVSFVQMIKYHKY